MSGHHTFRAHDLVVFDETFPSRRVEVAGSLLIPVEMFNLSSHTAHTLGALAL